MSRVLRGTMMLTAANVLAGVFNYLFLLWSAKRLDSDSLGHFSYCLSLYGFLGLLALVMQYWGFFSHIPRRLFRGLRGIWGVIALFSLHAYFNDYSDTFSVPLILGLAFLSSAGLQFLLGRFQKTERFAWLGFAGVLWAFLKMGAAWKAQSEHEFAMAFVFSNALTLMVCLVFGNLFEDRGPGARKKFLPALSRPLALAFAHSWFPVRDVILIKLCLGDAAAGEMQRLSLYSKVLYYAPLALLHVGLPVIQKITERREASEDWKSLVKLETGGLSLGFMAVLAITALGPRISVQLLHLPEPNRMDLFWACLSLLASYGALRGIQIFSALGKPGQSLPILVLSVLAGGVALAISWSGLSGYLVFSAMTSLAIGIGAALSSHYALKNHLRRS
jgi:O-antigen/teichoic acid export membrane protein